MREPVAVPPPEQRILRTTKPRSGRNSGVVISRQEQSAVIGVLEQIARRLAEVAPPDYQRVFMYWGEGCQPEACAVLGDGEVKKMSSAFAMELSRPGEPSVLDDASAVLLTVHGDGGQLR